MPGRQGVGIPPGGGGNGRHRTSYHHIVHQEAAGNHIVKVCLPTHLLNLCQGGADAGYQLGGEMVGPGHGR